MAGAQLVVKAVMRATGAAGNGDDLRKAGRADSENDGERRRGDAGGHARMDGRSITTKNPSECGAAARPPVAASASRVQASTATRSPPALRRSPARPQTRAGATSSQQCSRSARIWRRDPPDGRVVEEKGLRGRTAAGSPGSRGGGCERARGRGWRRPGRCQAGRARPAGSTITGRVQPITAGTSISAHSAT